MDASAYIPTMSAAPHEAPQSAAMSEWAALLARARQNLEDGHSDAALEILNELLASPVLQLVQQASSLRGRALYLRGLIHFRHGRPELALDDLGPATQGLTAPADAVERHNAFTAMVFSCMALGLYELGLRCAATGVKLALRNGHRHALPQGLTAVGHCFTLLGEPLRGEQFFIEALGAALSSEESGALRMCVTNLVYVSAAVHDEMLRQGMPEMAAAALDRAMRHVRRGEQLAFEAGGFHEALWQSNRAGWWRRRGQLEDAAVSYNQVFPHAAQQGWSDIARFAALGLAEIAQTRGNTQDAVSWLQCCVDLSDAPDAYGVVQKAHAMLAKLLDQQGQALAAARYREQAHELAAKRLALQTAVRERLALLNDTVQQAVAEDDRARLSQAFPNLDGMWPQVA
jgi:tetratricopeptide (TPR) repeat protein